MRWSIAQVVLGISIFCLSASLAYADIEYIRPSQHPNLYFNTTEIEQIRQAVLIDKSPEYAVTSWNKIKNVAPRGKPSGIDTMSWSQNYAVAVPATKANFEATLSYLIEPTSAKATSLRNALMSWVGTKTNAPWVRDGQNGGHIHFVLPFMYDALYNSGHLSSDDKQKAEDWFVHSANLMLMSNQQWVGIDSKSISKEGETRDEYPNWFQFRIMGASVMALTSKDSEVVYKVFTDTIPDNDYSLANFSRYSPKTRGFVNMLGGLVYPSGYNWDGYSRNYGFNAPSATYNGQRVGQGQHYHFFALMPVVLATEAVFHNGFDGFDYNNKGILRSFEVGAAWASTTYREPHSASEQPNYNWSPLFWLIFRHYPNNTIIKAEVKKNSSTATLPYTISNSAPLWGVLGEYISQTPTITPSPRVSPTLTPTPPAPTITLPPSCPSFSSGNATCDSGGVIDLTDFTCWKGEFLSGTTPGGCPGGADFDTSGGVDILDFAIWQVGFASG